MQGPEAHVKVTVEVRRGGTGGVLGWVAAQDRLQKNAGFEEEDLLLPAPFP